MEDVQARHGLDEKTLRKIERRREAQAKNKDLIYQFVFGLADISMNAPAGENTAKYHAARLRQIRSAAREYCRQIGMLQD